MQKLNKKENITHLFATAVLPAGPHVVIEARSPILQHVDLSVLLPHAVSEPALCLHGSDHVHRVEVHLQVLYGFLGHHALRAPRASIFVVPQPATRIVLFEQTWQSQGILDQSGYMQYSRYKKEKYVEENSGIVIYLEWCLKEFEIIRNCRPKGIRNIDLKIDLLTYTKCRISLETKINIRFSNLLQRIVLKK